MLSSVVRSPYICQQCRFQLLRPHRPTALTMPSLPPQTLRFASYQPSPRRGRRERDHGRNDRRERDYDRHDRREQDYGLQDRQERDHYPPERDHDVRDRLEQDYEQSDFEDRNISQFTTQGEQERRYTSPNSDSRVDFSIAELLSASAKRALERNARDTNNRELEVESGEERSPKSKQKSSNQWQTVGLRPAVAEALLRAFPGAYRMTQCQKQILPQLLKGYSLAAHYQPGSGKTFAITAWLLTLSRSTRTVRPDHEPKAHTELTTTALILVPNVELAQQYLKNITRLLEATGSKAIMDNPAAFVQALYRGEGQRERMEQLRATRTPHILIATPTALLDVLSSKEPATRDLVDYESLKAIVVEEADHALSRYDNPIGGEQTAVDPEKPRDPLLILLDYIFKARKVFRLKAGHRLMQPQLVFLSSATGSGRTKRIISVYHSEWLDGENRPNFSPFTGKGITTAASHFLSLGEKRPLPNEMTHIPLNVPDNLSHYIVAYDPATGFLRDAPVPDYNGAPAAVVNADLQASEEHQRQVEESLKAALDANATGELNALIKAYGNLAPEVKRRGYPAGISAEVLETLLNHDRWPRNVVAVVGESSSRPDLQQQCAARGIDARLFEIDTWNTNAEAEGRTPVGRLDQLLAPNAPRLSAKDSAGGTKEKSTVWIANYPSLRGLDIPGISHLYILHRLDRVREYITFAGRVARWPFSKKESLRHPRFMGRDPRPHGKVVSVLLEERGVIPDEMGANEYSIVAADGSEAEGWVWKNEALRLAKIGIQIKKYFSDAEQTAAGNVGYGDLGEVLRTSQDLDEEEEEEEVEVEQELTLEDDEGEADEDNLPWDEKK